MPVYEPVHQRPKQQLNYLTRLDQQEKKRRRRKQDDSDSDDHPSSEDPDDHNNRSFASFFRPINQTDPYHVAGASREAALPPFPFPYAAAEPPASTSSKLNLDDELAAVNPPIFSHGDAVTQPDEPFRRQHFTNLTAILHKSMRENDWARASRAFGILMRTEVSGLAPDLRKNGLWMIGAEILLRRDQPSVPVSRNSADDSHVGGGQDEDDEDDNNDENDGDDSNWRKNRDEGEVVISDHAFQLVTDYYERLILQYPPTRQSRHTLNALTFYPAFFSTWVYHVQARAQQARKQLHKPKHEEQGPSKAEGEQNSSDTEIEDDIHIIRTELDGAGAIASRLDDILISPPYDYSMPLLRLRGMTGLWISDLCNSIAAKGRRSRARLEMQERGDRERRKAIALLSRVQEAGHGIGISLADVGKVSEQMDD